jgi:transposase
MNEEWMRDARKIPDEAMSYIRKIAVRAIEDKGFSPESIAEILGISRTAIYDWLRRFDQGGYSELNTKKAPGGLCEITEEIEQWLKAIILNYSPECFGYDRALWTRDILAELINKEFGLDVVGSTVGKHLKKIGLSYQKPWFRSKEQDAEKVAQFLNDTFPRIQRLAKNISADIGFEDEAGVGLQNHTGKTWGEVGHTPEIPVTGKRGGYNLLSMITAKGELRFSIKDGKINSERYIDFLKALIRGRDRPLILIVDRASFHLSKKVRNFVHEHRTKLRVYFLPPYSPELNPDEQVWNDIKDKNLGKKAIKDKAELKRKAYSALRHLQCQADKIKSFFELPDTQYVTA